MANRILTYYDDLISTVGLMESHAEQAAFEASRHRNSIYGPGCKAELEQLWVIEGFLVSLNIIDRKCPSAKVNTDKLLKRLARLHPAYRERTNGDEKRGHKNGRSRRQKEAAANHKSESALIEYAQNHLGEVAAG